jgi:hypothetical protein
MGSPEITGRRSCEPSSTLKLWIFVLFAFIAPLSVGPAIYRVDAKNVPETTLGGKNWAYSVPFAVHNPATIEKLIQCESSGVNISRPDSDGTFSDGIFPVSRASKSSPIGSGTWAWMEKLSGLKGSPIFPADAIRMTDWAIDLGLIGQRSCARILHLASKT